MCGIIACLLGDTNAHCAPLLIDGLTMLQHRGQDAAGIATRRPDGFLALRKDNGLVSEVFQKKDVRSLEGNIGIGHCRYPTAGCSSSSGSSTYTFLRAFAWKYALRTSMNSSLCPPVLQPA